MSIPIRIITLALLCHSMTSSVLIVPIDHALSQNVTVTNFVNRSIVYIFKFAIQENPDDIQIATSVDQSVSNPVTFVSRHDSFIESWQLPLGPHKVSHFKKVTCNGAAASPLKPGKDVLRLGGQLSITVSASGSENISFSISLQSSPISVGLGDPKSTQISPHSAAIYRLNYGNHGFNSSAVKLSISSPDPSCFTVSIQQPSCPILDSDVNIKYRGKWFTMTEEGSLTVSKDEFPNGFYIIIYLHVDNTQCVGSSGTSIIPNQYSNATLRVDESIEDRHLFFWIYGTMVILTGTLVVCWLFSGGVVAIFTYMAFSSTEPSARITLSEDQVPDVIWLVSCLTYVFQFLRSWCKISGVFRRFRPHRVIYLTNAFDEKKSRKVSRAYLSSVLPIGLYYILPAVNLVSRYLLKSRDTGNMDMCYFNFNCAFNFYPFYDFNHVYSNLGYVTLGVASLVSVKMYSAMSPKQAGKGVIRQSGIAYALGVSIIFEGVLSACYHVCPNKSNFRHDTCFMYVSVVLMVLKLYRSRHPSLKCSPVTVLFCLSCFQCLDFLGQYFQDWWYFATFTALFIAGLLLVAVKISFLGRKSVFCAETWCKLLRRQNRSSEEFATKDIFLLISLGILANVGVICYNTWTFVTSKLTFDFGSYILSILIGNMAAYMIYYMIMKLIHGERIAIFPALTGVVSATLWIFGVKNFVDVKMSWDLTPSLSRLYNKPCHWEFYDTHDLWHLYSAGALYTSLLMIHTIDDDLTGKSREDIPVF